MDSINQNFIDWAIEKLGCNTTAAKEPHGDQSAVYNLVSPKGTYFLKIAPRLTKERDRLKWLNGKLPVPKIIGFTHIEDKGILLMSAIEGMDLAKLKKKWSPDKIINKLAKALRDFHAANTEDCPFGDSGSGKVLVHGDACLPNFIFKGDKFSGYIDLGDVRIDVSDVDLSASVGSEEWRVSDDWGNIQKLLESILESYEQSDVVALVESFVKRGRLTLPGEEEIDERLSQLAQVLKKAFAWHNTQRVKVGAKMTGQLRQAILDACKNRLKVESTQTPDSH